MNDKRILYFALGVLAVTSVGAVTSQVASLSRTSLNLSDEGITFPDGTTQTTAAAEPVAAWPMVCHGEAIPTEYPGGAWGLACQGLPTGPVSSFAVVPAGYFFLVTDILTAGGELTSSEFWGFDFLRYDITDANFAQVRSFRTSMGEAASQSYSFGSPLWVLDEGDYLEVVVHGPSGGYANVTVTGYLTDQPEKLRL